MLLLGSGRAPSPKASLLESRSRDFTQKTSTFPPTAILQDQKCNTSNKTLRAPQTLHLSLSLYKWIRAYRTIQLFRSRILTKAKNGRLPGCSTRLLSGTIF